MLDTHLVIGQVLRPQGIRGEVKVKPITADITRFRELEEALFQKDGAFVGRKVEKCRIERTRYILNSKVLRIAIRPRRFGMSCCMWIGPTPSRCRKGMNLSVT